jgi:hypothetical protein
MEMVTASKIMEIHVVLQWLTTQEDFILFAVKISSLVLEENFSN